jgi:drug/metabolite transporter (DMT)-like permease
VNRNTITGTLLVLSAACGYALLPIFAKFAYQAGMQPLQLLTWRFIIAAAVIWVLWPAWRTRADLRKLSRIEVLLLLGLGALFALVALLAFIGLQKVPAAIFSPLFYTYPALTALIAMILGERLPRTAWVAVALAVIGSGLTAITDKQMTGAFNPADLIYPLLTAAFYAIYLSIVGNRTAHIPGLVSGVMSITGSLIILLIASVIFGLLLPASPAAWLPTAGISFLSTNFTVIAMFLGIALIGAPRAAILSAVEPLIVVLLATLLLDEKLGLPQVAGGILILISVIILNWPTRPTLTEVELEQPQ